MTSQSLLMMTLACMCTVGDGVGAGFMSVLLHYKGGVSIQSITTKAAGARVRSQQKIDRLRSIGVRTGRGWRYRLAVSSVAVSSLAVSSLAVSSLSRSPCRKRGCSRYVMQLLQDLGLGVAACALT